MTMGGIRNIKRRGQTLIKFREGFQPDRIGYDHDGRLAEYGIKILGGKSTDSVMWDYENTDVEMDYSKEYDAEFVCEDDEDYGDVYFANGVCFGYVGRDDIET